MAVDDQRPRRRRDHRRRGSVRLRTGRPRRDDARHRQSRGRGRNAARGLTLEEDGHLGARRPPLLLRLCLRLRRDHPRGRREETRLMSGGG